MQITHLQTLINTPGTTTGLGSTPVPTGTTSDAQFKQQHFSGSQTDLFLSQTAALLDPRSDVQNYAMKLVDDHTHDLEELTAVAINESVNLQGGIMGNDQQTARQVLATAGSQSFDQTYLQQMVQTHTQDLQSNQQELNQTQDPNLRAYISSDLNTDFLHLLGAQALLSQSNNNNGGQHNRVIVLRRSTFNNAVRQLNQATNRFEQNFNINALSNSLFRISAPLAFGHSQLFPVWMNDLGIFNPNTPGSDTMLIQQLQSDLFNYLQTGQANGLFVVR
jgi:predicted outer membrane protein